jgi:hypothetical protein
VRARLFVIARFAAYAVIIAVGVSHVLSRDTASGKAPDGPVTVIARTTQGLPLTVTLRDSRVVRVDLRWKGRCTRGGTIEEGSYFADTGDFRRDGQRFTDAGSLELTRHGSRASLFARLEGEAENGVVRGGADFTLVTAADAKRPDSCESGPIGFAVDLPD